MATKKTKLGSTLEALQKAETQVERLRKQAEVERAQHLKELHVRFGFGSRAELIDALSALEGRRGGYTRAAGSAAATATAGKAKRKRARLTPEIRAQIVKAIKGGESGVAVAKRFSVSGQTVQNIKKAAGLVRARKKRR